MTSAAKPFKAAGKDVMYVDADDEITGIIDKIRGSDEKIVALVLPKRASMLQSVVNMKLLKRTADGSKKRIVLITSEASLLPLAGSVGVYVAKSLQSKPEIPEAPSKADDKPEAIDDSGDEAEEVDKTRTVGELAGAAVLGSELDDTIEMDDEDDAPLDTPKDSKAKSKLGTNKKLKIPDFNKFRLFLALGVVGVIALIGLLYVCLAVLPKASISIKTDSTSVSNNVVVSLNTGQVPLDAANKVVPATKQEVKKTLTEQAAATGTQNNGAKATGTIKFYNCNKDDTLSGTNHTIAAGTGVRANNLTFVTTSVVSVEPSHFVGNNCLKDKPSASVTITAQNGGAAYNQDATTYIVAGYSTITGSGSATAGGTDDIVKILTQADIDGAAQKISAQDNTGLKDQLKTDITNLSLYPFEVTFQAGAPETKTSANAGDAVDSVTVTQTITYSMLGAKKSDLEKVIAENIKDKIDPSKQTILDYGLDDGSFLLQEQKPDGASVTLQTKVVAGPDLDLDAIKKQVAGKKSGQAEDLIKEYPGVSDVNVDYSPFWVGSIPKKTSKITITVEKPQAAAQVNDTESPSR